jgi:transcriptional regulator with XRE-family HTH domain
LSCQGGVAGLALNRTSPDPEAVFVKVFCARIRAARRARGLSQADVARALGISRAAYGRCEADTPLPHHLIEDFVTLTGADFEGLFASVEVTDADIFDRAG